MFCNMYILVSSQGSLFIWPESIKFSFFPGAVAIFVNIFMNKITAARFCYIHFITALYKFWGASCFSDHLKFWSLASTLLNQWRFEFLWLNVCFIKVSFDSYFLLARQNSNDQGCILTPLTFYYHLKFINVFELVAFKNIGVLDLTMGEVKQCRCLKDHLKMGSP